MNIRKATEHDIPSIVSLLKLSLGEGLIKKSEAMWRWKHIENPFGESPVLLAEEGDLLVGVRAFMQWRFSKDGKEYKALRAVDTATHPDHRGKGIFKKLTLALIDKVKDEGFDFIFNTPNEQSKPGYLKMGWKELGRLPVRVKPFLFSSRSSNVIADYSVDISNCQADQKVKDYWQWRYADNPLADYYQIVFGQNGIAFFRIKQSKYFKELRICDIRLSNKDIPDFKRTIAVAAKSFGCRVISIGNYPFSLNASLSKAGFFTPIYRGLMLTGRIVNTDPKDYFSPLDSVDLDLGTFELF